MQLNPLQLVLVGAVLEITELVFEVPTGVVADTYSRRLSIITGECLIGIAFIVQASRSCSASYCWEWSSKGSVAPS